MKEVKLNSFAVHPQFKSTYHCDECKKLMNHESTPPPSPATGSSSPTSASTSGGSDTPDKPASIAGGY
jgi:hypothetical protein